MRGRLKKMNDQGLSSDIISTLPQEIIDKVLTLMPIRDALRTSILSSKWRYSWTTIPKLKFNEYLYKVESNSKHLKKQKFFDAVFHVLLLHKGPILEFSLSIDKIEMISKFDVFDLIILHLPRGDDLKTLKIKILNSLYKLLTRFFSLQRLEVLKLTNCEFEPPLTFKGFSRLRKVDFKNVKAPAKMLQPFLSNCPLLEDRFAGKGGEDEDSLLEGEEYMDDLGGRNNSIFVELLPCLPLIQILDLSKYYMKYMAAGGMPRKFPTSLVHLKMLYLDVCLMEQDEISFVLCMIRSSPNLKVIFFKMYDNEKVPVRHTSVDFLHPQDYSDLNLDRLKTLDIQMFSNLPLEMEFVKLIMAKSPMLKKAYIELNENLSVKEELKILRDFLQLPFPRAPTAEFIIERPKPSS